MDKPVQKPPITVSPEAAVEIRKSIGSKNVPEGWHLRVGVRGGGCGVTPILGFDVRKPEDLVFDVDGITILLDKKHLMFLIGKEIGFYEGADRRGFHVSDPKSNDDEKPVN